MGSVVPRGVEYFRHLTEQLVCKAAA